MFLRKINSFLKGFLLFSRVGLLLKPFSHFFKFTSNFANLAGWIQQHHKNIPFTDFYKAKKIYTDRNNLYQYVADNNNLQEEEIEYYEFGVAGGTSFKWWLNQNKNSQSKFWGFDTFEGLPEDWHFYKKGDMSFDIPEMGDQRAQFIKGLFQDTFFSFLKQHTPSTNTRKVIHMDADLYTSTLYVLTSMAPYLRDGDIILFDEFNVPNHEFAAWDTFTKSFYIDYEVLGGVNNYYQIAVKVKNYNTHL